MGVRTRIIRQCSIFSMLAYFTRGSIVFHGTLLGRFGLWGVSGGEEGLTAIIDLKELLSILIESR